ncbi:nitrate reductase [Rhizobium sp. Leaf384]|uniref:nitrate reductase n=1 Tax=unclassified Rhizobium TaxID=2613769 RepID=UPI000715AC00|nr:MULTISPECIES: nitrate reductase [unclassified Rhizobium]KQS81012.1 nitrate reductase [Rhizobium sp. Leaf384]KQS86866.1 nitrate reductase [Rhizobium sp. Leaf383]
MPVEIKTTCPYCGVGCGVIARVAEDAVVSVRGDPDHPANFGRLCSKGSALAETIGLDGRLLTPRIAGAPATWDAALDRVATTFSDTIRRYGPDSVAFYVSGQLLTEDYYVANKLMKGFIGSANIDTNSRLCMSSSVAGHLRAFGSDTVPGTYADLECADLVVLTGSNLAWCHPVLFQRLVAAKAARPHMKIVVIDPRRTATCDIADLHLSILPDGDTMLFAGLLAHLAAEDALDRDYIAQHTEGFWDALGRVAHLTLAGIAAETGLESADVATFYALFAKAEKTVTCYSQGVNQSSSGSDKVNAIINCHLATGRIGRPGMGPFSLTGQPNAMGGREVGGLANMLAAHMAIESARDRETVQRFWQSPVMANKPGLKAVDLFRAVADGRVKAIWIMATNPVVSMPEADLVRAALAACPFVVVSDVEAETDTTAHAHVLLPSLGWGEKQGTVTNSERRISRQRAFLAAPGEAKADWWQMAQVAARMGFGAAFDFPDAAAVFAEHAGLSAFENDGTRDFDIGAHADISADAYEALAPFQWPQPAGFAPAVGDSRFFAEGRFYHADGRARFVPIVPARDHRTTPAYPFTLNTGRIRDQWHTMTRTGRTARLTAHLAEPFVEIHPDDAQALGLTPADLVVLASAQGRAVLRALVTARQKPGHLFAPMHWNDQFSSAGRIDALVPGLVDPVSGQPASKHVPVRAAKLDVGLYGFAISLEKPRLSGSSSRPLVYHALARAAGGWRLEFAAAPLSLEEEGGAQDRDWTGWSVDTLGIPPGLEPLGYRDAVTGQIRMAFFDGERLLGAVFLSPRPVAVARNWAISQLNASHSDLRRRFAVVAGRPGAEAVDPGATVCSCFNVGINQIVTAAAGGCRTVEAIGKALNAGTDCGSCRAEIREILHGTRIAAAE